MTVIMIVAVLVCIAIDLLSPPKISREASKMLDELATDRDSTKETPKANLAYRQFRENVIAEERKEQLAQLEAEVFAPITIETVLNDPDWTNLPHRKELP